MVGEAMTPDYITALTASGKSLTLEFKETSGTRREAAMTVLRLPEPARRTGAVRRDAGRGRSWTAGQ